MIQNFHYLADRLLVNLILQQYIIDLGYSNDI